MYVVTNRTVAESSCAFEKERPDTAAAPVETTAVSGTLRTILIKNTPSYNITVSAA